MIRGGVAVCLFSEDKILRCAQDDEPTGGHSALWTSLRHRAPGDDKLTGGLPRFARNDELTGRLPRFARNDEFPVVSLGSPAAPLVRKQPQGMLKARPSPNN